MPGTIGRSAGASSLSPLAPGTIRTTSSSRASSTVARPRPLPCFPLSNAWWLRVCPR